MNYIQQDTITRVPIEGGELRLSAAFDVLHRFSALSAYVLKYWDSEAKGMSNVMMTEASAKFLVSEAGLMIVDRPFITASEHDALLSWRTLNFDAEFGL